jgi:hypothetical protein
MGWERSRWIFRGDEDDLFEFVSACDAPSVYEDSDASSDGEETETGADTDENNAASGDDPGDELCRIFIV